METSVAKRPRLEPRNVEEIIQEVKKPQLEPRNAEEIIEEQRRLIENLKARIQQFEAYATETKIKNVSVPELPDEIWLEIMSYLSNFDVLRNVAAVSKRFHQLSQDRNLIRKIQVDPESWPKNQEKEYCKGFRKVLKRSLNLTFLSFDFRNLEPGAAENMFFKALPFLNRWCPNLKVLKLEFKPQLMGLGNLDLLWPLSLNILQAIITGFKHKKLQEFHMTGFEINVVKGDSTSSFKKVLETFAEKLPKLQRLCLTTGPQSRWR